MKIQAVHRGNAARSKLEARLSRKETSRAAAAWAEKQTAGAMEQHLASIGFTPESAKSYAAVLIEEGFDGPAAFATLTIEELREDFGFKRGHLRLVAAWKAEQAEHKAVGKTGSGGKSDRSGRGRSDRSGMSSRNGRSGKSGRSGSSGSSSRSGRSGVGAAAAAAPGSQACGAPCPTEGPPTPAPLSPLSTAPSNPRSLQNGSWPPGPSSGWSCLLGCAAPASSSCPPRGGSSSPGPLRPARH